MSERPTILVVDDDAPILLLMKNLLREYGFDTVVASSGADAVDKAAATPPDLVLLDLNMPGMSGDETLRRMRSLPHLESTPVLILSGEPIERTELTKLGADGAVLKPFDVGKLIDTIRSYLDGRLLNRI